MKAAWIFSTVLACLCVTECRAQDANLPQGGYLIAPNVMYSGGQIFYLNGNLPPGSVVQSTWITNIPSYQNSPFSTYPKTQFHNSVYPWTQWPRSVYPSSFNQYSSPNWNNWR